MITSEQRATNRIGGQGQNRTVDTRIFSPLLYQLSYLAGEREWQATQAKRAAYLTGDPKARQGKSAVARWIDAAPHGAIAVTLFGLWRWRHIAFRFLDVGGIGEEFPPSPG